MWTECHVMIFGRSWGLRRA